MTRAPARAAHSREPSVEPLSATITSPAIPPAAKYALAFLTHSPTVLASFRQGMTIESSVFMGLSSGRAKISISSADGKKIIIRIAKGGDILGLYAGLTGRPFEATAEMLAGGRVDFISRQDLLNLIRRQNGYSLELLEVFSRQFSELIDHTRMLALSESALEKLAHLIARWGRDFGERTSEGIRVRIWLTQEEIAQIIGASRETVTRLFSALKRDGIVHVKRDLMWIRDSDALASLARMSPEMCD